MCTFIDMDDKEIVAFLNNPENTTDPVVKTCISKAVSDQIVSKKDFTQLLIRWKPKSMLRLTQILQDVCINDLSQDSCTDFFIHDIIPKMMSLETETQIRDNLIEIGFMMCSVVYVTNLSIPEYKIFLDQIYTKYIPAINQLRESNYGNWHKLWIFMIKFCAKKIHESMDLTNRLLRILENAFRSPSTEQRLHGYDCWKELIKNASLNKEHLCSSKQMKLLVTPLKAKFSRQEAVIARRFEVFVYLLEKLQEKTVLCLNEFLEFCFGSVGESKESCKSGHVKNVPQVWANTVEILLAIIGHSHNGGCIVEKISFGQNILNKDNFPNFYKNIINSVAECCILLRSTNEQHYPNAIFNHRNEIMICMWRTVFNCIISGSQLDKNKCFDMIANVLSKYLELSDEELLNNIFTSLLVFDKEHLSDYLPIMLKQLVKIYLTIEGNPSSVKFIEALQHTFAKVLTEENKMKMFETLIDNFKNFDIKEKPTSISHLWIFISEELINSDIEKTTQLNHFEHFFKWPYHNLHTTKDDVRKLLLMHWTKLYKKITFKSEQKKLGIMQDVIDVFKNNSLLAANVTTFLNIMSQFDRNQSKDFTTKLLQSVLLILELPNLDNEVDTKLCQIVLQYLEPNLEIYKDEYIDFITNTLFGCLKHILSKPNGEAVIVTVINFLKSSFNLQQRFAKYVEDFLVILNKNQLDSNNYQSAVLSKILSQLTEGAENIETKTSVKPSGRSARIASMVKNSPTSPIKSKKNAKDLRLFGKDLETMSPLQVKGSMLNNTPTGIKKVGVYTNDVKPKVIVKPLFEENSSDFVSINTEVKFQPDKLSDHQKEMLRKRSDDIPALYQDLTQSLSQDIFSSKASSKEVSVLKTEDAEKVFSEDLFSESLLNNQEDTNSNQISKEDKRSAEDISKSKDHKKTEPTWGDLFKDIEKKSTSADTFTTAPESIPDDNVHNELIDKDAESKTVVTDDSYQRKKIREINRLKMDLVGVDNFAESQGRTRVKKTKSLGSLGDSEYLETEGLGTPETKTTEKISKSMTKETNTPELSKLSHKRSKSKDRDIEQSAKRKRRSSLSELTAKSSTKDKNDLSTKTEKGLDRKKRKNIEKDKKDLEKESKTTLEMPNETKVKSAQINLGKKNNFSNSTPNKLNLKKGEVVKKSTKIPKITYSHDIMEQHILEAISTVLSSSQTSDDNDEIPLKERVQMITASSPSPRKDQSVFSEKPIAKEQNDIFNKIEESPKRKRGRPVKIKRTKLKMDSADTKEECNAPNSPKIVDSSKSSISETEKDTADNQDETPVTKKRGRPSKERKHLRSTADKTSSSEIDEESKIETSKRRNSPEKNNTPSYRGRAAKILSKLDSPKNDKKKSTKISPAEDTSIEKQELKTSPLRLRISLGTKKQILSAEFVNNKLIPELVDQDLADLKTPTENKSKLTDDENDDIIESSQESFVEKISLLNSSKRKSSCGDGVKPLQIVQPDIISVIKTIALELPDKIELHTENNEHRTVVTASQDTTLTHSLSSNDSLCRINNTIELPAVSNDKDSINPEPPEKTNLTESELIMCQKDTISMSTSKESKITESATDPPSKSNEISESLQISPEPPKKPMLTDSELVMCQMDTLSMCVTKNFEDENKVRKSEEEDLTSTVSLNSIEDILASPSSRTPSSFSSLTPSKQDLPSSPITTETPTRTNEFLNNTVDISPITSRSNSEEEIITASSTALYKHLNEIEKVDTNALEVKELVNTNQDDLFEEECNGFESEHAYEMKQSNTQKPTESDVAKVLLTTAEVINNEESIIVPNQNSKESSTIQDRASKLQGLIQSLSNKPFTKRKGGTLSSPSTVRIKKLFSNMGQIEPEYQEALEVVHESDILTFSREIPSPLAVPRSSILKRKLSDISDGDGISPCAKRKRVNFSDPCLTAKKIFIKDDYQPTVEAKRLFDTALEGKSAEERLKNIFDFPDDIPSSKCSEETDSDLLETELSLKVVNPMVLQKNKAIFPKLQDCPDDVLLIVKKISSPMFVTTIMNKLKSKNVKTIGDLAKLSESEVNRFPFKVPVVSNVLKALEKYYSKNGGLEISSSDNMESLNVEEKQNGDVAGSSKQLDVRQELRIVLNRTLLEKTSVDELAKIILPYIQQSQIYPLLKSYCPSVTLDTLDEKDYTSILKNMIKNKGMSEILKRIQLNFCQDEKEQDFHQSLSDYVKYTVPLEKIFIGRNIEDLEVGIEESIKNKVFQKSDVIEHCLLPLVESPNDLSSYFNNLSSLEINSIVTQRVKTHNPLDFFKQIIENYLEIETTPSVQSQKDKIETVINTLKFVNDKVETLVQLQQELLGKMSRALDQKTD